MIIDAFSHIYPEDYISGLKNFAGNMSVRLEPSSGYTVLSNHNTGDFVGGFFKKGTPFMDPEVRLEQMAKYGIDKQILTIGMPGLNVSHTREVSDKNVVSLAKIANDSLQRISEKYPDNFAGVAEVPITSEENFGEALDEIDRAINELGLKGIQLYTLTSGTPLEDKLFHPIYSKALKYDIPVLLHPTNLPGDGYNEYQREYKMNIIFGWPFETSIAMSRLAFSGTFDKFPGIKFMTHHLGGMIPYFAGRYMLHFQKPFEGSRTVNERPAVDYMRDMYHDTAVYGNKSALLGGYSFFGSDKILFGTDYPFGPEEGEKFLRLTAESIRDIDIPDADKDNICYKNALKLFKLDW